jgi:hypothetical protein
MDIQAEKIELAKLLLSTDNPRIVQAVKLIFKKNQKGDFWDDLTPEEKAEIEQGITELEQGKKTDYEAFMAKHR